MFSCLFSKPKKTTEVTETVAAIPPTDYFQQHLPPKIYKHLSDCCAINSSTETTFDYGAGTAKLTVEKCNPKFGMVSIRILISENGKHLANRFNFSDAKWHSSDYYDEKGNPQSRGREQTSSEKKFSDKQADDRLEKEIKYLLQYFARYNITPGQKLEQSRTMVSP